MSRKLAVFLTLVAFTIANVAISFGPGLVAYAGGGTSNKLSLPLKFETRQLSGELYVDEVNYLGPTLIWKETGTFPGSPAFKRIGLACPSYELAGKLFGGENRWTGGYTNNFAGIILQEGEAIELNIQYGRFWRLEKGELPHMPNRPADASADQPHITAEYGEWLCYSPDL